MHCAMFFDHTVKKLCVKIKVTTAGHNILRNMFPNTVEACSSEKPEVKSFNILQVVCKQTRGKEETAYLVCGCFETSLSKHCCHSTSSHFWSTVPKEVIGFLWLGCKLREKVEECWPDSPSMYLQIQSIISYMVSSFHRKPFLSPQKTVLFIPMFYGMIGSFNANLNIYVLWPTITIVFS